MDRLTIEELNEDDIIVQFSPQEVSAEVARWVKIYAHKYTVNPDGTIAAELSACRWLEIEQLVKGLTA